MTRTRTLATMPVLAGVLLAAACAPDAPDAAGRTSTTGGRSETTGPTTRSTTTSTTTSTTASTTATTPTTVREPREGGPFGSSRLAFFDDCPALLDHVRTMARERVTAWGLGGGPMWYGRDGMDMTTAATAEAAADDAGSGAPASTPAYSSTNTQEAGVDEGDVVETDGEYVYAAEPDGVRIVDVDGATIVERLDLPDGDHQLLLDGGRLVVATQAWTAGEDTVVSVFDVGDPSSPALLRRSHLEGRLVAARSADGTVRLVLSSSFGARLPFVQPQMFGLDEDRALERNRRIIDESTVQDWLPRWFDEAADGSFGEMAAALDCATVAAPAEFSGLGVSWIASIDVDTDAPPVGSAGIVSSGETVYASPTGLYVATVPWDWYSGDVSRPGVAAAPPTVIHEFALGEGTSAAYVASGEVPGTLLNQFSMSEHDGVLRVATTEQAPNGGTESSVHTVRVDTMEPIASIGGLGAGEQIYAVRFLGPTAYVVTFRQVDPLYVIDLTDPANPVLRGELKIPGYSAYLHPVGDGLLLGIGQDATDQGQRLGTQLSLFDVSDPGAPQRLATLPVGGWSDAEWDHHAFLYWSEDGTIVIPVSPGWSDCGPAVDCLASDITSPAGGVVVARLADRTLEAVGTISHDAPTSSGCWNPLRRSLVIGSELVTVGLDQIRFSDRASLAERATVRWGGAEELGCAWWTEG